MQQEVPFSIQVEMVEGCNLFCPFCGVRGIRKKKNQNIKFAKLKTMIQIAKDIKSSKWSSRIEFAMHGEPTLHPDFFKIIKFFRKYLPSNQLMLTTNGYLYFQNNAKKKIKQTFKAGLNILAIDAYNHSKKDIAKLRKTIGKLDFEKHEYPEEKDYSPHKRYKKGTQMIIFIQDIRNATKGGHSVINNHCGCAAPPLPIPLEARCAKPFRELSFRYNGKAAICCNDWRGIFPIGSIHKMNIIKLWNHKRFKAARKVLYDYSREFPPCNTCDALSYRIGFLPDKMGKQDLKPPKIADFNIIKKANTKGPLTKIVKRKWEH